MDSPLHTEEAACTELLRLACATADTALESFCQSYDAYSRPLKSSCGKCVFNDVRILIIWLAMHSEEKTAVFLELDT